MRGKPPKKHKRVSVSVGGAQIPACGAMGWETTDEWDEVTCKTCERNRDVIDKRNEALIEQFNRMATRREE